MRKLGLLLIMIVYGCFYSCNKDDNFNGNQEITFNSSSKVIVDYVKILAYDSAQYIFQLDKQAWGRMKSKITPIYPDPNFGFGVTVDNELIYKVAYIPGYHSYSYPEVIKFAAIEPDLILLYYGHYEGIENVNDDKVIEILSKDGKLKTIDLEVE